ncbi:MAG: phosphate ABC transporter ATP-binding protein PstB [Bacteroidales bacterium]
MKVIETVDLNVYYKEVHALKNVTMSMNKNSITALMGPSGCGKSTYLRALNRMNDLIEGCKITGQVLIEEEDAYAKGVRVDELRKKVGMVFQKPNPFPMSIFENVAYGLRVNGIRDKKFINNQVEKALSQSALLDEVKDSLKKSAMDLSGGQQQRLCIARALVIEPSVVLMDEPTSALDPISSAKIEELMFSLKKNYTIVIVTHNIQQAARISDNTAFFYIGELIEYGSTKEIFTNPKHKRTQNYITGRFG